MKQMRRCIECWQIVAFTLLSILTFSTFSGCQIGGSGSFVQGETPAENNAKYTGDPAIGDWIVLNLLGEPEGLNPLTSSSASARYIYDYIYEAFLETRREPPWDEVPLLVESKPETSEDHLIYTWKLRRDIYWHDGRQMTMRDAEFTLKTLMNPYVDDLHTKPYYNELDSLALPDEFTIVMYCSQPYFMHVETLGGFSVQPEHVFDPDGLLSDLSYYQVKHGSAFGYIADLLDVDSEVSWNDLPVATALYRLEQSIESVTNHEIKWKEVLKAVPELEASSDRSATFDRTLEFLGSHPNGGSARSLTEDVQSSVIKVLGTLDLSGFAASSAGETTFTRRDSLGALCRDIHTRIETYGRGFNSHPQGRAPTVGSGPYKFERWVTGQEVVLQRNENYWQGEGKAYLDKIIWRILTDYTASLVALKNGEIDFMTNLQTIQYLTMTNREKFLDSFVKGTFTIPSYTYLGWRNNHPIFKDRRVRQAMSHMVRREDARDKLLFGFAEIVNSNFYRYGPDYDTTIVGYAYDPEKAQQLLAEAGWADMDNDGILEKDSLEFRFEMLLPSSSVFAEQLASILREDLYMIGIEMNIRRLEWSVFINNYIRNKQFEACYLGWVFGMRGDPKQLWHSESSKGRGSNYIVFNNSEADSLIDAARLEFNDSARVVMYRRFQQILFREAPYTFLLSTQNKPAYDKRFKGVRWYPFRPGYQFDEWFVPLDGQKYQ